MSRRFVLRVVIVAGMMLSALSGVGSVGAASVGAGGISGDAPGVAADVPASWWAGVQEEIRRSEYQVSRQEGSGLGAVYQAPNRAHNLRTYFEPEGIRMVPRTEGTPSWAWGLRLAGYGREGSLRPVAAAEMVVAGNRVAYERGELTEWYVNDQRGLEQGFTLSAPPVGGGSGWLALEMALAGHLAPRPAGDEAIEFLTAGNVCVLRYAELRASDAAGRALPAWLEVAGEGLRILVDDAGAEYPLTIDPLATTPAWSAEGDQAGAQFGWAVATAGDVDGDGYDDVIVGAPGYDVAAGDEGRAYLYLGSPAGLGATPAWTADGERATATFGYAAATAGDVNGDGYDDVIVGAPGVGWPWDETYEGRAYLYYGAADGLGTSPGWIAQGSRGLAYLGTGVAGAGDVDGDGYADVVVGEPAYNDGVADVGRVLIYRGSAGGLGSEASWSIVGDKADARLGYFGYAVGAAGDVNGDGHADVLVADPDWARPDEAGFRGRVLVYHGSASGPEPTASWVVEGSNTDAYLGYGAGTAGDVNGDGFDDVIVGEPGSDCGPEGGTCGQASVYHGSASGLSASPDWAVSGQYLQLLGLATATAGDVNGDGYADVVVGARDDGSLETVGQVYLYQGSASGLSSVPAWVMSGGQTGVGIAVSVGTAGDVNGDGYADAVVGVPLCDGQEPNAGRALLYYGLYGAAADLSLSVSDSADPVYAGALLMYTVSVSNAGPSTAGGVSVTVDLPEAAGFLWAMGAGWVCQEADGLVTCERAALAPGEAPPITIVVDVPGEGGPVTATAQVSAVTEDPDVANNTASVDTTVIALADLALSISDSPDPVCAHAPVTYTVSASNAGPSPAEGVVVTETLPVGTEVLGASGSGWVCEEVAGAVICSRAAELVPGNAPPLTIVAVPPAVEQICVDGGDCSVYQPIKTTARVSAATEDPDLANNVATAETAVIELADLSLSVADSPDPVYAGAPLTYTLVARNNGPCTSGGLTIESDLPAGATFVSAGGTGWTCEVWDGQVTCTWPGQILPYSVCDTCAEVGSTTSVGSRYLEPGEEAPPLTLVVTAPGEGGVIASTAVLTGSIEDPDPANNTVTVETTVIPHADLALYAADTPDPVYAGAPLTYTVQVANAGLSTATMVEVAATLPVSSTFVSAAGEGWECTYAEGVVTCRRGSLEPGMAAPLTIVILAPETRDLDLIEEKEEVSYALISAGFAVSAVQEDPEPGDNQVVVETTVRPGRHHGDQK